MSRSIIRGKRPESEMMKHLYSLPAGLRSSRPKLRLTHQRYMPNLDRPLKPGVVLRFSAVVQSKKPAKEKTHAATSLFKGISLAVFA